MSNAGDVEKKDSGKYYNDSEEKNEKDLIMDDNKLELTLVLKFC